MGAAGRAARGRAQHLPADAAARPQHRRLHAVPDGGDRRVRRTRPPPPGSTSSGSSTRSTTSTRCGPAIDAVRATGTAVAEVALCYTGDLSDPAEKLYTLDYYLRLAEQIVEAGAHVLAIKDMAGLLRAARRPHAGHGAARAVRPAGAPAHPRHRGRPAGHLHRRDRRRGWTPWTRPCASMAGTTSSRRCPRWSRPPTTPTGPPGWTCRRSGTWSRTGRRCGRSTRRSSPGLRVADRPGLPPRDPRRAAVQPAAAGHRAGAGRPVRADRGLLRRRRPDARAPGQGHPVVEGGRRPRAAPGRARASRPKDFEADPGEFDMPDSVIGFLPGELGDPPGGWPEPFRTKALAGRPRRAGAAELTDEDREGLRRQRPPADAEPAAVPRADQGVPAHRDSSTATCRCCSTKDYLYGLRARASSTPSSWSPASRCCIGLEAISEPDERGYAHGGHHPERAAAAGDGAGPQRRRRRRRPPRRPTAATRGTSRRRSRAW